MSAGLAAVTKPAGLFIIIIIVFYIFLTGFKWRVFVFDLTSARELAIFCLSAISICGFWYAKITSVYGSPWYMPYQEGIEKTSGWFAMLSRRPRYGQFYYFVYLSPIFILFYFEILISLSKRYFTPERLLCLIWFFLAALFLTLIPAKEERYMLSAYPPIAILSSVAMERIRRKLNAALRIQPVGDIVIILIVAMTCVWSIKTGLGVVFDNCSIFHIFNT
ncbi:MAG: hypothetical protein HY589_03135, partial [Candidatus Omnitrophica bacterium]|nr:hypothetical protein [Candidatus Omnitrophota bacterium]